jgi:hypothetical protein
MNQAQSHSTLLGTVSGTVLTVLANIGSQDIAKTVILAAIGATVSFCISVVLKWMFKQIKNKFFS